MAFLSKDENMDSENSKNTDTKPIVRLDKTHCMTVCMVPPIHDEEVWEAITKARVQLRDPGLYRWPPHVNLLYPFVRLTQRNKVATSNESDAMHSHESLNDVVEDGGDNDGDDDDDDGDDGDDNTGKQEPSDSAWNEEILEALQRAIEQIEPFQVILDQLGTFGGKRRGVLWLSPSSFHCGHPHEPSSETGEGQSPPLVKLQRLLEQSIPQCSDQSKSGQFTPHMTLSHFESLDDAHQAQASIEKWWKPVSFRVDQVYALQRVGDGGQFQILATLPLGGRFNGNEETSDVDTSTSTASQADTNKATAALFAHGPIELHESPLRFPLMPTVEEEWVRIERMALKKRRNSTRTRRGRQATGQRRPTRDTPEEIQAKRAARQAKREAAAQENKEGPVTLANDNPTEATKDE